MTALFRFHTFALLLASIIGFPGYSIAADADTQGYLIQPGDVLDVSVWKEEDLTRPVLVRPDGAISFPLAGEISAAGRTLKNVSMELQERLQKFIPDPVITLAVQQVSGNKIYVIGKVTRPGEYVATRYLDVMQALSMAGGTTTYAAVNKIKILRRKDGQQRAVPFEYSEVEKGENLEQNIVLEAGDIVVVP